LASRRRPENGQRDHAELLAGSADLCHGGLGRARLGGGERRALRSDRCVLHGLERVLRASRRVTRLRSREPVERAQQLAVASLLVGNRFLLGPPGAREKGVHRLHDEQKTAAAIATNVITAVRKAPYRKTASLIVNVRSL